MVGSEIIPMVMTLAPTMPVDAARMAPTTTTEIAMPPRRCPKSRAIVSSSSSAMPDFSRATPMKTKSGTARRVKFVIVPQIRMGRMLRKSGRRKPRAIPNPPKRNPVKVRLKATGKPRKRNAIMPANMNPARIWSSGRAVMRSRGGPRYGPPHPPTLGAPRGTRGAPRSRARSSGLPPHGPVERLDGLGDALDHQEEESRDDHRLEQPAKREPAGIGRALPHRPRGPDERPGRVDDQQTGGEEEQPEQKEIEPRLATRRELRVHDVDADVLVVQERVAGREQVEGAEEVPLGLLHAPRRDPERVA